MIHKVKIEEYDENNCFIAIPDEIMKANKWRVGTKLEYEEVDGGIRVWKSPRVAKAK